MRQANASLLQRVSCLYSGEAAVAAAAPASAAAAAEGHKAARAIGSGRGLEAIAEGAGLRLIRPRACATILIIGSHSSGKSSFINAYIGQPLLKTSAAVETTNFVLVRREAEARHLQGPGLLHVSPALAAVADALADLPSPESASRDSSYADAFTRHLELRSWQWQEPPAQQADTATATPAAVPPAVAAATAAAAAAGDVEIMDTPGLTPGGPWLPAVRELAGSADLVLFFLDPAKQALGEEVRDAIRALRGPPQRQRAPVDFLITRADTLSPADRMKTAVQVTSSIAPEMRVSGHAPLQLRLMWLPGYGPQHDDTGLNAYPALLDEISKLVQLKSQRNVERCVADAEAVGAQLHRLLADDDSRQARAAALRKYSRAARCAMLACAAVLFLHLVQWTVPDTVSADPLLAWCAGHAISATDAVAAALLGSHSNQAAAPAAMLLALTLIVSSMSHVLRWAAARLAVLSPAARAQLVADADRVAAIQAQAVAWHKEYALALSQPAAPSSTASTASSFTSSSSTAS